MRIFAFLLICCLLTTVPAVSAEQVRKGKGPPTKEESWAAEREAERAAAEAAKKDKLTMADCDAMETWTEDYSYCVCDMAVQEKSIYFCAYLEFPLGARECIQSVAKLTKVTADDCKKMTSHEDMCLDVVKEQEQEQK